MNGAENLKMDDVMFMTKKAKNASFAKEDLLGLIDQTALKGLPLVSNKFPKISRSVL